MGHKKKLLIACLYFWILCVFNGITVVWQRGVAVASESCLQHSQWQCSEPVRRRWGRELDGEQWTGGVHQRSEGSGHTSPDEAQHPPLQGNSGFSSHLQPLPAWILSDIWPAIDFHPSVTGVPVRCVHPRAAAVWGQGVHGAAAASQWGLQLQLLASGWDQGAWTHHAPADLWAG